MESSVVKTIAETIDDIECGTGRKISTASRFSMKRNIEAIKNMQKTILMFLIIIILTSDLIYQILNKQK